MYSESALKLYIVAGSSAMNGHGEGVVWGYEMPIWCVILIVVDCAAVVGFGIWGFFAIRTFVKRKKSAQSDQ